MDYKQQTKTKNEGVRMIAKDDKTDLLHYTASIDELVDILDPILDISMKSSEHVLPKSWAITQTALSIGENLPEHAQAYVDEATGYGALRLISLVRSDISLMALAITKIMGKYE